MPLYMLVLDPFGCGPLLSHPLTNACSGFTISARLHAGSEPGRHCGVVMHGYKLERYWVHRAIGVWTTLWTGQ